MNQKLSIMMIADVPRNLSQIKGGLEAATVNLITSLRLLNVDLHVVTIRNTITHSEIVRLGDNCVIYYYPFSFKKIKILDYMWFGQRKIKSLYKRLHPNIVHMQGTGPVLLMLRGIDPHKIVITQHGIMSEEMKYKVSFFRKSKFYIKTLFDRYLIPQFDNYIAISEYNHTILDHLQKFNMEYFTRVIHNPVNPEFFQTRALSEKPRIVFVGLVNKLKGVHILIEALDRLKKEGFCFTVDIVGGTKEPDYLQLINTMIRTRGLEGQVVMHGWVSQQRVKELIQENCIFLLPSLQECLPISIAEAMAAGRVVVATQTGGIPEMFTDKESGFLFPKNDVGALTAILRELHLHPETMTKVGAMARKEAARKFESGTVARQTLRFYDHLTNFNSIHKLVTNDVA